MQALWSALARRRPLHTGKPHICRIPCRAVSSAVVCAVIRTLIAVIRTLIAVMRTLIAVIRTLVGVRVLAALRS